MSHKPKKHRVDVLLVERGLAETREKARALILAGKVFSGERRIDKAGDNLASDAALEVRGQLHAFVSRGGVKLDGALDDLRIDVQDLVCVDVGASTGGFTDCLLQRGASRVFAIDVGYGQLHERLRRDPRVVVMERTNARYLTRDDLDDAADLVVIDASFIGLEKLLPSAKALLRVSGEIVAMVKPQFEVGRAQLGKRGVVTDTRARLEAISRVEAGARALGLDVVGRVDARIAGPEGNLETFLHLVQRFG